jgi:Protein of unknown function (DUF3224)
MEATLRGTYRTTGWRQQEYGSVEHGPKLALAEKELTGSSVATGHVCLTGRLGARSGSFVVEESVKGGRDGATATWRILPESCSGELRGLVGEGTWEWKPGAEQVSYTLSYRL